jgi:hypothetical protein
MDGFGRFFSGIAEEISSILEAALVFDEIEEISSSI